MKKIYFTLSFLFLYFSFLFLNGGGQAFAQCKPIVKVDGGAIIVDPTNKYGAHFPFWLKAGQSLAAGSSVSSISVIEFNVNVTAMEFSQVLSVTTIQTVPAGKVWKVESALKADNPSGYTSATFTQSGTYTFKVPACAEQICIEVWGAGGGGSGCNTTGSGGGGGGGGYGQGCFTVTPSSTINVTVGAGGAGAYTATATTGGTSSVGALISATGGSGGTNGASGAGGAGGTSTALNSATGGNGGNGTGANYPLTNFGGAGGNGGNGGNGGVSSGVPPTIGNNPGGGGGGWGGANGTAARGADGKVIITW